MKRYFGIVIISGVGLLLWWWIQSFDISGDSADWFLGSWVQVDGETHYRIDFEQRLVPGSNSDHWVHGLEGHVRVTDSADQLEQVGRWNYGYLDPVLGLNLMFEDESYLLIIQQVGANRMRARRLPIDSMPHAVALEHGDTRRFKRVATE